MRALLVAAVLGGVGLLAGLAEGLARGFDGADALAVAGLGGLLGLGAALLSGLVALALRLGGRCDPSERTARLLAATACLCVFVLFCDRLAAFLLGRFRDPRLMALVLAVLGAVLATALALAAVPLARKIAAGLRRPTPTGPRRAGVAQLALLIAGVLAPLAVGAVALTRVAQPGVAARIGRATWARVAVDVAQVVTDFDADGSGLLTPPRDCAPFDARAHPGARDRPGNRVDEDCSGKDGVIPRKAATPRRPRPRPAPRR